MATKNKPTLLWLEDSNKTVSNQIIFSKRYFSVETVSQLHDFRSILEDESSAVKAIVLDIMVYRVYDLNDLGINDVDTDDGYEAGWRVLEYYLRAPESQFKQIPVLVLSVRAKRDKDQKLLDKLKQQDGAASIQFIEKRGHIDWYKEFEDWIRNPATGRVQ